jgi:hypothetical protein
MSTLREINRLALGGLISKDQYIIDGFTEEVERMMQSQGITDRELVDAVNSLIDSPVKDRNGDPQFVTVAHLRTRVDYIREHQRRKYQEDAHKVQREGWKKHATGVPACWNVQMEYLELRDPTEADKQRVLDSIREEMNRYEKGSEMYKLWMEAGLTWKGVRV